ncbi:hypothetical protein INR49_012344 [Caranx melampygus]|nr:hypothetical protein INR49_012344 [Caranx melampygus]
MGDEQKRELTERRRGCCQGILPDKDEMMPHHYNNESTPHPHHLHHLYPSLLSGSLQAVLGVKCEHEGKLAGFTDTFQNTGDRSQGQTRAGTTLGITEEELRGERERERVRDLSRVEH